jgi:hypothetical protein
LPAINLNHPTAAPVGNVFQNGHKLTKCQIAHFATPQPFHRTRFKSSTTDYGIPITEFMCQFEKPAPALVGGVVMRLCQTILIASVSTYGFAAH